MITSPNAIATPTWPSAPVFCVDHDRAAAGEDERERPDRLRDQHPRQRRRGQSRAGSSSPTSARTRVSSSSRILRTVLDAARRAGSSSTQSSYRLPG